MFIALDKEQKRISINEAVQGETFFCPVCLEKMFLKAGKERTAHFAHYPHSNCYDGWNGQYDMSDWHYDWQNLFPPENQEVVVQWDDIRHRADVLIDHTVVEFQHSPLSSGKFNDRNVFYQSNIGYKVVWLYDMQDAYQNKEIIKISDHLYKWEKPLSTFRKYTLMAGQIDLFFQISDGSVVQIKEFTEIGFIIKKHYTKEEFLEYVGLHNNSCLPPAHIDIQVNEEYRQFAEKYHIQLNLQQQRAVQAITGANLMIAVPGSGKTTVMVARIGYMIFCKHIPPEKILAITYTKSATKDITERFASKFGDSIAQRLNIRTINSLCEQIIKRYTELYHRERFTLLKENEQAGIVRSIYTKLTGDAFPHDAEIIEAQAAIGLIKNMMLITPELRTERFGKDSYYESLYLKYCETLKNQKRMDFDDQLIFAKVFLEKFPRILNEFQDKYQYICVDEAQDTSKIQHEIIHILSQKYNNIFMVGDEDQSIYRFRGAYPRALLDFADTYTNPYILFLETNYRSTEKIVCAAQHFISRNINRHSQKRMVASRDSGKAVERIAVKQKHEQYSVMTTIAKADHGQIAVLYRNNGSAIPLLDSFLRENIPFKRLKDTGENFFTSRVVQDIVFFLRFALNGKDAEAFNQIYYKCGYGIRKQTAYWCCRKAKSKGISISDELINQWAQWPKLRRTAESFKANFNLISKSKPAKAIELIAEFWYKSYAREKHLDLGKISILYALAVHEDTIPGFLERLKQLPILIESYSCTDNNPIILSTIHSAKGLEFDSVYIVDAYDGSLPHADRETAIEQERIDNYEEERRVFYVAITRAKNELYLFSVEEEGTSFIDEIVPSKRELPDDVPLGRIDDIDMDKIIGYMTHTIDYDPIRGSAHASDYSSDISDFRIGTRVKHTALGNGTISDMQEYDNGRQIIAVKFDGRGEDKFDLKALVEKGILQLIE